MITEKDFANYLKSVGYSEVTPSGRKSTVYDYQKRVLTIIEREGLSNLDDLADNIGSIVAKYDLSGTESEFGSRSHNAYINAQKRFEDFTKTL